jgi:uncharacterized protein (DUF1015 family)
MAIITPFRAVRPVPEYAAAVASLPYDVLTTAEARECARQNPHSFVRVIRAEVDLPVHIDSHAPDVYARAAENMRRLLTAKILAQDSQDCLYLYRERLGQSCQTGVVACTPVDDYRQGRIKIHEHTRPDKVQDRRRYIEACGAHTGLIFLTYRRQARINALIAAWIAGHAPVYDFASDDGVEHTVWVVDERATIGALTEAFAAVDALYVADGHHRAEAAAEFARLARQRHPGGTGEEPWNQFLAVLFPSDELTILAYHRVVADLNGLDSATVLTRLAETFELAPYAGAGPYQPEARHTFGMYLDRRWYRLRAKAGTFLADDPVQALDTAILQHNLFASILGIANPRTDPPH